jgi:hypothetical protein
LMQWMVRAVYRYWQNVQILQMSTQGKLLEMQQPNKYTFFLLSNYILYEEVCVFL